MLYRNSNNNLKQIEIMKNRVQEIAGRLRIINVKTISNQNLVTFIFLGKSYNASYYTSNVALKTLIAKDIANIGVECFNVSI